MHSFLRKPVGKNRPLQKPSSRWNIKMDFEEIGYEGLDWIHLAVPVGVR
jgi:hypothetical protein